jgi:hypothetical protein
VLLATIFLGFALMKSSLGIDFTDEGLYVVAPLRLVRGESLFSSELLTLTRPFELVSQVFFRLLDPPSLYGLRLCGWTVHICAYLVLFVLLAREAGSVLIPAASSATSFFFSFAWESTIATPNYKSLSTDFLLLFLCLFYFSARWPTRELGKIRVTAGLSLFLGVVCYPPLILIGALTCAYELRLFLWNHEGSTRRNFALLGATIAGVSAGLALLGCLWTSGAMSLWFDRIHLVQSISLTSVRSSGLGFYVELFRDIATKTPGLWHITIGLLLVLSFTGLMQRKAFRRFQATVLALYVLYSIFVIIDHYHGDSDTEHFFFPTTYCLVGIGLIPLCLLRAVRLPRPAHGVASFCLIASGLSALIYATATYFFDYYYSWNSGLLGLPFAFSFNVCGILASRRLPAFLRATATLALLLLAAISARYNYEGVRRDSAPEKLTAQFSIPPLRNIYSTSERVVAVEALYSYLKPLLASDQRLLAFDDCPMLYFILEAKPAYGLAWAVRYGISPSTHDWLVQRLLAKPLPKYAVRTMVDLAAKDWSRSAKVAYGSEYRLNETVESRYRLIKVLYPFEVFELR